MLVIEGVDSSGKGTQAKKLYRRLSHENLPVKYVDFPAYDSRFGELVAEYLRGEHGSRDDLPVEIRALLYALDRYQFKDELKTFLADGGILIANRYSQSNFAYQAAHVDGVERHLLVDWMKAVESRLPQPDEVFFLRIPTYVTRNLMQQKRLRDYLDGAEQDLHEEDLQYQKQVAEVYLDLAKEEGWTIIDCVQQNTLRTEEDIHEELYDRTMQLLQEHGYTRNQEP